MGDYDRLLNHASQEQLDDLAGRYPHFLHFVKVLECLAETLEAGDIILPSVQQKANY